MDLKRDRRGTGQDPPKPAPVERRSEGLEDLRHPLGCGDVVAVGDDLVALSGGGAPRAGAEPCRQEAEPAAQRRERDRRAEHEGDQQPVREARPKPRLGRCARVRGRAGRAPDGVGTDRVRGPKRRGGARGARWLRAAVVAAVASARARRARGGCGVKRALPGGVSVRAQRVKRRVQQPIGARAGRQHRDQREPGKVSDQRPSHASVSLIGPARVRTACPPARSAPTVRARPRSRGSRARRRASAGSTTSRRPSRCTVLRARRRGT